MTLRKHGLRGAAALVSAVALTAVAAVPASADNHVLADGFVSPLDFAFGSDGTVYVAEAFAGELTAVPKKGERKTIATADAIGGVDAKGKGTVSYTQTLPPELGSPPDTTLNRVLPNGKNTRLASMAGFEAAENPDSINTYGLVNASTACVAAYEAATAGNPDYPPAIFDGQVDSNPYAVAIDTDGARIVADAAGNTIVRVSPNGKQIRTVAVLPAITQTLSPDALAGFGLVLPECVGQPYESNPVPTDIEIGPGGHYYVSALPGFPEAPGEGRVYRIDRNTGALAQVAGGFTGAVDIAVAADGTIYVAELFAFQVSRVDPGGTTASKSVFVDCPTAVEMGPNGAVYAAEGGICDDSLGRIVRVDFP